MLDPNVILAAIKSSMAMGSKAQASLQAPFMAGAASMSVDGAGNAANIISSITQACQQMATQMAQVNETMAADLARHQAEQKAQKPADFNVDLPDLRNK
jgi:hypothetical protein